MAKSFLIALPVRDGGDHFKECVRSILAQTYPHFELVVLDNASTDDTLLWLRTIADSRVTIVESTTPLGIEGSWARVASLQSRHEYMTVTGHDDVFDPNFLQTICELIDNHPQASLYVTHFRLIDTHGRKIRSCTSMPSLEDAGEFLEERLSFVRDSFGTGYVFRAADYIRVRGIPLYPKLLFADDALWIMLMGNSAKATHSNECFAYRVHTGSTSYGPDWRSILAALKEYLAFLKERSASHSGIARALQLHLANYGLFWARWTHFSAGGVELAGADRMQFERAIADLAGHIRDILGSDASDDYESRIANATKGVLAQPRWIIWRICNWLRHRIA